MRFPLSCLAAFPLALCAAEPLPGHSEHGEVFNEGPRQAAFLIEGCGKVDFPVTTSSAEAQKFFNQGVGQLHGFWYYEAERSFRQVALLDPDCAMAYWGCAMANWKNEKRASDFIKKATEKKDKASPREQAWIAAVAGYFADLKKEKKGRSMEFIKKLESIIHDHPDDLEAKAFLGWAIWKAKDDSVPMVSREAVDAIISQVLAKEPLHPAHHYRIHLWDDDRPARALSSAALCGQSAPAIAHMWHMPGHTFSKVKRPYDAAWQQEAATRVDHAWMERTQVLPDQIHNYAHNEEWLVRTFSQIGRARDGLAVARNMVELPRHPKYNTLEKQSNSAAHGRNRMLEILLRYELWDDILALEGSPYLDATQNPSFEAAHLRARGIAAYFKGDKETLVSTLTRLQRLRRGSLVAAKDTTPKEEPPKEDVAKEGADKEASKGGKENKGPRKGNAQANQALAEIQALTTHLQGRQPDVVLKQLALATDVPKERLAVYYHRLGKTDKALETAGQLPEDVPGLALRAEIQALNDKKEEALKSFEKLRKEAAQMDRDLPLTQRMDKLAVDLSLPGDWRLPLEDRSDSGTRPDMASLGPLLWQPFASSDFTLPDADGKPVSLQDYRGKPVVVIFYLGGTCTHCMEQLKGFTSAAKDFTEAGISLLAIGSEPPTDLKTTAENSAKDPSSAGAITLLADPGLGTFKTWRCHDDFENQPLHGTFLVDGNGSVRWLDVGYDPFGDAKFLLQESKRLLRFPSPNQKTKTESVGAVNAAAMAR